MKAFDAWITHKPKPDFRTRGYMLDVSRCKVPTMDSLRRLVDLLAGLRYNQLQLYTEHTFAYTGHETVWCEASPLTTDEIKQLDAYCDARGIELVPNQNSFGHMERWLRHPPYRHLAECPDGFTSPFGDFREYGSTLRPNAESLAFIEGLYDQLLPCFRSKQFNIGGDEPWELGLGWSKQLCVAQGKHRVYLNFLKQIHKLAVKHGRRMQCWADIVLESPELIPELPKDLMPVIWGYEADHPFPRQCEQLAAAGLSFMIAPGDSTWQSTHGRLDNALVNIANAVRAGKHHGAEGLLLTHWGDHGHWQPWVLALPAMTASALAAWDAQADLPAAWKDVLSKDIFRDETGLLAEALAVLGSIESVFRHYDANQSVLFNGLFGDNKKVTELADKITDDELDSAQQKLETARRYAGGAFPRCGNAELLLAEVEHASQLSTLGLQRLRLAKQHASESVLEKPLQNVLAGHERLWLARNRPGGQTESGEHLRKVISTAADS